MKPNSLTAIVAGPSPGNTFLRTTRAVLEALALINVLTLKRPAQNDGFPRGLLFCRAPAVVLEVRRGFD